MTEGADRDVWGTKNLRRAIKAAGVALWSWNVDTDRLALDDPACDLWGVERSGDVTFEDLSAHIHPADRDRGRLRCNTRDFRGLRNRLSDHGG